MKICIYSGTFNPVHTAHVKVITGILDEFNFYKVIVIPNNIPPHKNPESIAASQDRLNMLKLAFDDARIEISDIEIKRGGKSYSYHTVQEIKKQYNIDGKIDFLIGTDAILGIKSWYNYKELINEINFIVVKRQNEINIEKAIKDLNLPDLTYQISKVPFLDISSSQIRKILNQKNTPQNIIPERVLEYILQKNLYQNYNFEEILDILKTVFNSHLEHSLAVAELASRLAKKYGIDENQAYLAGILHDCVKYIGIEKIKTLITENNIEVFEQESQAPKTLHAPVGAYIAEHKFGIKDKNILDAIRFHTIGRCNMSLLEKIIFISDKIEPVTREKDFRAKILPQLHKSLDHAIFAYFELLIEKLKSENAPITPYTQEVFEHFKMLAK
jgi:nicotinate-nucleotide adenylyltransferase